MAKTGPKGPSKYTQEYIEREAQALLDYIPTAEPIPFLKHFTSMRDYSSGTIFTCGFIENAKFLSALNKLKEVQESKLVHGALTKKLDGWFAFQTLKNVAGWRDKTEIEHEYGEKTLDRFEQMSVQELKKRANELGGRIASLN